MEPSSLNSKESGDTGRSSMLSHLRKEVPAADTSPSSTLHAALAKVNQEGGDARESKGVHSGAASSALPLAMARANDSRRPSLKKSVNTFPPAVPPSLGDLFFNFGRFSDSIRPLKGIVLFVPILLLSTFLWVHQPGGAPLPAHPEPALLLGTDSMLLLELLRREIFRGLGVALAALLLAQGVFMLVGKGRPPLVWTLKILVYAMVPVTLLNLFFFLRGLEAGLEVYLRGYEAESNRFWYLAGMVPGTLWASIRISRASISRHCQARFGAVLPAFLLIQALLVLNLFLRPLETVSFPREARVLLEKAERSLADGDAQTALDQVAGVLTLSKQLPFDAKIQLYRIRGEAEWQTDNALAARDDFLRLYRMHPHDHPLQNFGVAATRLVLGQRTEGETILLELLREKEGDAVLLRWSASLYLGRFGGEPRLELAEASAQKAWLLVPNPAHAALLVESWFRNGKDRPLLRFVLEHEADHRLTVDTHLMAAVAALRQSRETEARRWTREVMDRDPTLLEDARAAPLREAGLTSRP